MSQKVHNIVKSGVCCCYCSVCKLVVSSQPHGLQHARLLCPPRSPGVCSNSCTLSWWFSLTIILCFPFTFSLQSFPASGSFPISQLFASGAQSIGASASAWVLPMNIQGWFPLVLTGLISTVQAPLALLQMKWNGCRCKKSEGKAHSSVRILLWCGWWVSEGPPTVGIARQQKVRKIYIQVKGKVKVTQLCPTLCDLMDCTVHGILQARILDRVGSHSFL